ncbi:MAG: HAD-IA family hydrolase [Cyanobacteriota bacterium]|nr:HAD-IA family hydrolase [Cyanobacteriota bacterium]
MGVHRNDRVGLEALLWDVDGTLADTEFQGHRLAFNQAFAAAGLDWRWDEATYGQLLAISGGRERIRHFWQHGSQRPCAQVDVEALMAAKQAAYASLARCGTLPLRPGVGRLVREAAAWGLPQALVTTSSRSAVAALLEGQDSAISQAFGLWICGEDVSAKKPNPEAYQLALARLGVPPERVVALEDSPQGLAAAQAAQLPCLLTVGERPSGEPPWWRAAEACVSHLGEAANPSTVWQGPPCAAGQITLSWIADLLEQG